MRCVNRYRFFAGIVWSSAVLATAIYLLPPEPKTAAETSIIILYTLGVPAGPIAWMLYACTVVVAMSVKLPNMVVAETIAIWLVASVSGYIQWLVVTPWAYDLVVRRVFRRSKRVTLPVEW